MSLGPARPCRYCGAPMVFVRTVASNGQKMIPLDREPVEDGPVQIDMRGWAYVVREERTLTMFPDDIAGDRYQPHHDTCPNWPGPDLHQRARELPKPRRDIDD